MGAFILAPDVALRSWERVPFAFIRRFDAVPHPLSLEKFEVAAACDGVSDIPETPALASLLDRGVIVACEPGAARLDAWQRWRMHPYRVMPWMALEITGRCNYNCLHCFNAEDNGRLQSELSLAQAESLLDQASETGVQAVLITGGEPLVHPRFSEIVAAVYARNMFVHELNTNGRLLTHEVIEGLRRFGPLPELKISFDGLGYHDWMRNKQGAEGETLRAIRLSLGEGASVRAQVNANRRNRESIRPTVELLAQMGVQRIRVICTTATPRWEQNAPGETFGWEEFFQLALETSSWYIRSGLPAELDFWHAVTLRPQTRTFTLSRARFNSRTYRETSPICDVINGMPAVCADGQVCPCLQYSGTLNAHGISLGNALESGLLPLLREGRYFEVAHATIGDRLARGEKCASCEWNTWCAGGCPALGFLASGCTDFLAHDPTSCIFFENGWFDRFAEALSDWSAG